MLTWPAKDPDETLDYEVDWTARLAGDTVATSLVSLVTAAELSIASQSNTTTVSRVWLSGGVAGATAELIARIVTAGGRTMEEGLLLPIVAAAAPPAPVGYEAPTPAQLRARFAAFDAVAPATLAAALARAARMVDETWAEDDFAEARMLYAAHLLTLDGLGSSREVQLLAFKRISVGPLELERSGSESAVAGSLTSTGYGARFAELRRLNFVGGTVTR